MGVTKGEVTRHEDLFPEKDTIEEVNEDIIKDKAPSSKSASPANKLWVQRAVLISDSLAQEEEPLESPEKTSGVAEETE